MENNLFQNVYNPDVLSCIANLSNDEVFTPPELANKIIDMLPQELFENPDTTFLDPCCKSGVFLREIAKRLIKGLEPQIPDLEKRIEHIFSKQLFGIAITELTSLLSRRSVYCSKYPSSEWSAYQFPEDKPQGNIIYQRIKHTWKDDKCVYCGASKNTLERGDELETHAYQFIHNLDVKKVFNMKFDVIIGNPPYQLNVGVEKEDYAIPIYHKFVEQAKRLNPRYLSMIIPARWYAGGRGLDEFRFNMLNDDSLKVIHDFPDSSDCFSGVNIRGGVCYFLWDKDYSGKCSVTTHLGRDTFGPVLRPLLEEGNDTFIRYNQAISIIEKVYDYKNSSFSSLVSSQTPFGLVTSYKGEERKTGLSDLILYKSGHEAAHRGQKAYVPLNKITRGYDFINKHKVYLGEASSSVGAFPHAILTKPFYGEPGSVCTQSYLVIGPFESEDICKNVISYIKTRFFRFMVLQRKNTQHNMSHVFRYVPIQDFTREWSDDMLYAKYKLTNDEVAFIESMVKPME